MKLFLELYAFVKNKADENYAIAQDSNVSSITQSEANIRAMVLYQVCDKIASLIER